ncbi:MAG: biotin--[acetyl-CoA-carboxylase] ligase, partial [Nannocystaceae bacterium]
MSDGARDDDDDLTRLGERLTTRAFGRAHEHHAAIASTNDRALAWAAEGAPQGALVTADRQVEGRGRRGRAWASAPGDLAFSLVFRPGSYGPGRASGGDRWGALGLAVGVGVREGLAPWLREVELKWPNDLRVGGRKLAGILCE